MFKKARLKLTFWYLFIIMLVSVGFSLVIYQAVNNEVDRFERMQRVRIERRGPSPLILETDVELLVETKTRVLITLAVIDGTILLVAGVLGYFLAGRTLQPIEKMIEEQNRFVGDASHELKTPLASLKSALEVYLRDKNQTIGQANMIIKESLTDVNRLQLLSESLLTLNRYQTPNESLSIKNVADQAIVKVASLVKQKKIKLETNLQDFSFKGNRQGVIDLLVILLDNAIKYSSSGKSISIKTDAVSKISIEDHGIGISQKDLPHIFDRFYRADEARSTGKTGGFGLGLAIAKNIADTHKAAIDVKSKPGAGATFSVTFQV